MPSMMTIIVTLACHVLVRAFWVLAYPAPPGREHAIPDRDLGESIGKYRSEATTDQGGHVKDRYALSCLELSVEGPDDEHSPRK